MGSLLLSYQVNVRLWPESRPQQSNPVRASTASLASHWGGNPPIVAPEREQANRSVS